jgi:alkanesulfonate monooxygenase SsuD/methylene tetrahydromethanopterin reductase-like flavin-dependent oxidoreductase (luciferase family)
MLAKIVSTLDVISRGRSVLGVGAGWSQTEFEGYGQWVDPGNRVEMTEEGLNLILKLWTEETVSFQGRHYRTKNAVLDPKPVQKPHPPLLFGGVGPRMFRMAGKYADICFIAPWTEIGFTKAKDIVLKTAKEYHREGQISFAAGGPSSRIFGPNYERRRYMDKVKEAEKNNCDYFIVPFPH